MWAAMNGHSKVVEALIDKGVDKDAVDKVRSKYFVSKGCGANDKIMFGTGLRATGRKCPIHCSRGLYHEDQMTIVPSCARNVQHPRALTAHSWCCRA
jgi:hypothetical protein